MTRCAPHLIGLLASLSGLAQDLPPEALWPRGAEVDFGALATRAEVIDTFWLANPTAEAIVIETVRPSCGCTAVEWPRVPLEPGALAPIVVAFRCTRGEGPVRRHLDVWLSHLRRRERLYVYADCPPRG